MRLGSAWARSRAGAAIEAAIPSVATPLATNWRRLTAAALAGAGAAQQPHVASNPRENLSISVSIVGAVRLYQSSSFAQGMFYPRAMRRFLRARFLRAGLA